MNEEDREKAAKEYLKFLEDCYKKVMKWPKEKRSRRSTCFWKEFR